MRTSWLAIAAVGACWALPAQAQMVRAQDPSSVQRALQAEGYTAKVTTDKDGDPLIESAYSGSQFEVYFYNCTNHKECATVQFHAGYDLSNGSSLQTINAWNKGKRFGRGYLDDENDPHVEMDVDLDDGGMSQALFVDNLEFWTSLLPQFESAVGYKK
jgi:hypothetical protein